MSSEKILLVEDDSIARLDITVALERAGYQVAGYASSGEKAIELADTLNPDLVRKRPAKSRGGLTCPSST